MRIPVRPAVWYEARERVAILTQPGCQTDERLGRRAVMGFCRPGPPRPIRRSDVVITGNGRTFCAGADMGDLNSIGSATVESAGDADLPRWSGSARVLPDHPGAQPSSPINGACAGIGLTQALMCDVRFRRRRGQVHDVLRPPRLIAEYGILDPASRHRLGRGADLPLMAGSPSPRRPPNPRYRARSRPEDPARHRPRRGHRGQPCAELAGGDQATGVRRRTGRSPRAAALPRRSCTSVPPGLHRGHHRPSRSACRAFRRLG